MRARNFAFFFYFFISMATAHVDQMIRLADGMLVSAYELSQPILLLPSRRNQTPRGHHFDTRVPHGSRSPRGHPLHRRQASVLVQAFGVEYTLELRLFEELFHPDYHVIHMGPDGIQNVTYGVEHCYYSGRVAGYPDSWVVVDTCQGVLEGVASLGHGGAGEKNGRSGEDGHLLHFTTKVGAERRGLVGQADAQEEEEEEVRQVIYRSQDLVEKQPEFECGTKEHADRHLPREEKVVAGRPVQARAKPNKYIEFLGVNDFARVTNFTSAGAQAHTIKLVSLATLRFASLSLSNGNILLRIIGQVVLTSEIFLPGVSQPQAEDMLTSFCTWRAGQLGTGSTALQSNDVAHLFSGRDLRSGASSTVAGISWVGTLCEPATSCGVNEARMEATFVFSAVTLTHELGHNLNSVHDGQGNACPSNGYIMSASACDTCESVAETFSTCSASAINAYLNTPTCLGDAPSISYGYCGDSVVNGDEACDGGLQGSVCCAGPSAGSSMCQFKGAGVCEDSGNVCCLNCQYRPTSYACQAETECYLQSNCTAQGKCPSRQKKADGTPCSNNGTCQSGTCQSRATACTALNGRNFTVGGATIVGPFSPCDTASCHLKCRGQSGSCLDMTKFSLPANLESAPDGVACSCPEKGEAGAHICSDGVCSGCRTTTPTSTPTADANTEPEGNAGAIAGAVVGGLVLVGLGAAAAFFIVRRKQEGKGIGFKLPGLLDRQGGSTNPLFKQ